MIDMLYLAFKGSWGLDETPLRLVHYTTTRMVLAFLTAFAITYAISPRVIKALYKRSMRDQVRDYGKEFSQSKSGTPTMGGLIIIAAILTAAALWCNPRKTGSAAGTRSSTRSRAPTTPSVSRTTSPTSMATSTTTRS